MGHSDRQLLYTSRARPSETYQAKERKVIMLGSEHCVGYATGIDVGYARKIVHSAKRAVESRLRDGPVTFKEVRGMVTKAYDEVRSGKVPKNFDVDLIIAGLDEDPPNFVTHETSFISPRPPPRDFSIVTYDKSGELVYHTYTASIGSASDTADRFINEFLETVNPRQPYLGLVRCAQVVMEAHRIAEKRHRGSVGERDQLVWINDNPTFQETSEKETSLLGSSLRLKAQGLLTGEVVNEVFKVILNRDNSERDAATRVRDKLREILLSDSDGARRLLDYVLFGRN